MKLRYSVDRIDRADDFTCLDLVSGLYVACPQFAIEREIISMLNEHALVVSRHHDNLFDLTVEYRFDRCPLAQRYVHAIVERQFDRLENRMVMLSEMVHYRPLSRPRQFSFVLGELRIQLYVDRFPGCRFASLVYCRRDNPLDFTVQGIDLFPFGGKLLLVFYLVSIELRYKSL